jgi:hypothetical protein
MQVFDFSAISLALCQYFLIYQFNCLQRLFYAVQSNSINQIFKTLTKYLVWIRKCSAIGVRNE